MRLPAPLASGLLAAGCIWLAACEGVTVMDAGRPIDPARPAVADTLATGTLTGREGQAATGTYALLRVGADLQLRLGDDFRSTDGPDLHVVLTPTPSATVSGKTALASGAVAVSKLTSRAGAQAYDLPDTLALGRFNAVLVHCVRHAHLYGAAPLAAKTP